MPGDDNVTQWFHALRDGSDDAAAQRLWDQYFDRLVRLARQQLGDLPRREADEEDIALSAMHSFVQAAANGRFSRVENRQDLWKVLVTIALRKVSDQRKRHFAKKRGGGNVRGESVFDRKDGLAMVDNIDQHTGVEPTPEFAVEVIETCRQMLDALDDETLRSIATMKLEGYTNAEISQKLEIAHRSIERKLNRIRSIWDPTVSA